MYDIKSNYSYSENLLVHFRRIEELKGESLEYPSINLNKRQLCDLELLLNRAFYPLTGYLSQDDYESVLERLRLGDGTVWPMPICLDVSKETATSITKGGRIALRDEEGFMLAILTVEDIWKPDKRREAISVFGTEDPDRHPGVRFLYDGVEKWYIGGFVEGIQLPIHYDFKEIRLSPAETHRQFSQRGWRKVVGFQTEKNLHCAHKEMTLRAAKEVGASIFLQPATGLTHPGDIDHYTRVHCYQEIVKQYPPAMIMLGLIPMAMRMAGPREALWQAIIRKNYGCSHFIVADDHGDPFANTGTGEKFYPLHAAQEIVKEYEGETGIKMAPLKKMVYVEDRAQYIPVDKVTQDMKVRHISSSELRHRLEHDLDIPEWFSYPGVVRELKWAYPPRSKQGFTIFFTGLSGAGKSTIAKVLMVKFMEMRDRPVTLLDGDVVRRNLSSELGFSREHRNLNITRIGFVASEITKNGGIAICAPIAPYEESRRKVRELISRCGGFFEVYVSTPLDICEQRDRKGIYAKAKAGKIKGFTGVDDPYILPSNPEITINTTEMSPEEAAQEVFFYLVEEGYFK